MNKAHSYLEETSAWYKAWHQNSHISKFHFAIFILYSVAITSALLVGVIQSVDEYAPNDTLVGAAIRAGVPGKSVSVDNNAFVKAHEKWKAGGKKEEDIQAIVSAAKERKEAILSLLAQGEYDKVPSLGIPREIAGELPEEVDGLIEESVEVTGTYMAFHADDDSKEKSRILEVLTNVGPEKQNYNLYITSDKKRLPLNVGDEVVVNAFRLENSFVLQGEDTSSIQLIAQSPTVSNPEVTTGAIKYTTILVNFTDDTSQPFSVSQVQNAVYGSENTSVNGFIKEASFGKASMTGNTYGWFTVPYSRNQCDGSSLIGMANAGISAAKAAGADGTGRFLFIFPRTYACGWAGVSTMGGPSNWSFSNGYLDMWVVGHEIGHSFGINHAGSYNCGSSSVAPYTSCTWSEYGDPFDLMGNSGRNNHFNAALKTNLKWFGSSNIQTVTQSGTYKIAPLETSTNDVQVLRIAKPDSALYMPPNLGGTLATPSGEYYYVEYRQRIGADSNITDSVANGALIHAWNDTHYAWQTRLFDMTPGDGDFTNAALKDGQTFTDSANGVTITQVSHDATGVMLNVTVPATQACTPAAPTITLSPVSQSIQAGLTAWYSVTVKNNDSANCSQSSFALTNTVPSGTTGSFSANTLTLNPGSSGSATFYVGSTQGIAAGTYAVTVSANNATVAEHKASASASLAVTAITPDTTPPTVSITSPTEGSRLTGSFSNISASATDNKAVAKVEFIINGKVVATDSALPYAYKWNIKKVAKGNHTITAKAYDTSGNTSEATVTVIK